MKNVKRILFMFIAFLVISAVNVNAQDFSAKIDELLTDGKLVMKSIKPTTDDEASIIISEYIGENIEGCYTNNYNADYTSADIVCGYGTPETFPISITYEYDETIKAIVDGYVNKITKDRFSVNDLEVINFWLYGEGNAENLSKYSEEFKKLINYKNFILDIKMGSDEPFATEVGGPGKFKYDNVLYNLSDEIFVEASHIIYVPTGTSDENLLSVAQKRIDDYVGSNKVILSSYSEFLNDYIALLTEYNENYPESLRKTSDEINQEAQQFLQDELTEAGATKVFKATIGDKEYSLFIVADSSKMVTTSYKTSDLQTDVTITSDNGKIPLDTLIKVSKLTSGSSYDKIIKILNITANEMFDLNLYSISLDKNITKLEDGSFEVRIPISEKFKGKSLIVYYVDEEGKKVEYTVTIDGDYAVFNTNHFSIYTLAEDPQASASEENPQTYDGIINLIFLGSISMIGIVGCSLFLNKRKETN